MSIAPKLVRFIAVGCLCTVPCFASTHHARKTAAAKPPIEPVQQAPVVPQRPPTPEELPATPPRVTMSGGQLSIVAENSTLGDVLTAVKGVTGATLEAPGSFGAQRVVVQLGPGQPQQVLQQLLAGSNFDYIILGSPTNPSGIQKIILTSRGAAGNNAPINNAANQPGAQPRPGYQPPDMQADTGNVDEEIVQPEPPQQEEVTPPSADAQQQQIGPGGEAQQQQGPKTPEQLLQELQRMQQQQQQQQQQGRPQRGPVTD